jgi:hypothetical protein
MAVFGKILYLPYSSGTIVFVSVLVVFTLWEGCELLVNERFLCSC